MVLDRLCEHGDHDLIATVLIFLSPECLARAASVCQLLSKLQLDAARLHASRLGDRCRLLSSLAPSLALKLCLAFDRDIHVAVGAGHVLCRRPHDGRILSWGADIHEISRENFDDDGEHIADEDIFMGHLARKELHGMGIDSVPEEIIGQPPGAICALAAGYNVSVLCTEAGEVYAWGETCLGDPEDGGQPVWARMRPTLFPGLAQRRIVQVACSSSADSYLARDMFGQLLQGSFSTWASAYEQTLPGIVSGDFVTHVSCSKYNMLALTDMGWLWTWSNHKWLQEDCEDHRPRALLHGTAPELRSGQLCLNIHMLPAFRHASEGDDHTLAVTTDGRLYGFGRNDDGQLALGDDFAGSKFHDHVVEDVFQRPTHIRFFGKGFGDGIPVREAHAGSFHSVVLTELGEIYTFGSAGSGGRLGHPFDVSAPRLVRGLSSISVVQVSVCGAQTIILADNGAILSLGEFHCYLDQSRDEQWGAVYGIFCACCASEPAIGAASYDDPTWSTETAASDLCEHCNCIVENPALENVNAFVAAYKRALLHENQTAAAIPDHESLPA